MKRFLCLTLAVLLAFGLLACGGKEEEKVEKPAWAGQFAAGYGKANVTPDWQVVMGGYTATGEATRKSTGVLNDLYITCVALTDESGNTALLYTYDSKSIDTKSANTMRAAISEATGVPVAQIYVSATHTHSAPNHDTTYLNFAIEGAVKAAQDAMADRAAVTVEYVAAELEGVSYVRHYMTDTGIVMGSNFNPEGAGKRVSHTTEADKELRLIRLSREGKQPILMANWLGHNSIASTGTTDFGKAHRYYISADYVGFTRDYIEKNSDYLFALYMGASGNISVNGRLAGENAHASPIEYGDKLGQMILDTAQQTMTAVTAGAVGTATTQFDGVTRTFDIDAMGIGGIGVISAPVEMFDTTSMAIREKSPYEVTFVLSLCNGANGYLPTEICYDYIDCYECRGGNFKAGDAERIVDIYVDLLNQAKG